MSNPLPTNLGGPAHESGTIIDVEPAASPPVAVVQVAPREPKPGFNPMIDLRLDGRMVRFCSEAADYEAPAVAASLISDHTAGIVSKQWGARPDGTFGYWPDDTYVPSGWQEI